MNLLQEFENPQQIEQQTTPAVKYHGEEATAQNFLPTETAILPYKSPAKEDKEPAMDFDILDLINDIDENQMVIAASQIEQNLSTTTVKSKTETTMFKSSEAPSPFSNCRIGSIGTININIYKN